VLRGKSISPRVPEQPEREVLIEQNLHEA
jgi:hypothetical protein